MDFLERIQQLNVPEFRKKQIYHAIFKESKIDSNEITTLPLSIRSELSTDDTRIISLKLLKQQQSQQDNTIKWSFLTSKGKPIETVLMLHANGRRTLCISCQSGCPVNCSFCWTGAMGFQQNLSAWEIIEQILVANNWIKNNYTNFPKELFKPTDNNDHLRVNRIVFMGMGEPMINLIEVTKAIQIINNPEYLNLGQRAITVSTSGYVPMMKRFWSEYPKIGVAISLHAPTQEIREQIMPVAKQFSLDELMQTCKEIQAISKRRITYEYILIDDLTDTEECAYSLAQLLKGQLAHVNVIPYNPIEGRAFKRPSRNRVMSFTNTLKKLGISVTARVTMGDDIKAACGQLSKHTEDGK